MNLSPNAQATLLLTSYFSKGSEEIFKPLSNGEWGRFALWLKERNLTPADLLTTEPINFLKEWHDENISIERIIALLRRGHSLALSVEKWHRAGLWVVTRSDPEYPRKLKARLKSNSPPVLFGCGNRALLNIGGIAVVGSRDASIEDLIFTEQFGAKTAVQGVGIVSGGARGIDETAMLGAINAGGNVIGIMADSLLKAATASKWRKGLMDGKVVLVSPFYPEAGFNAGNAMARNKYIYCLADTSIVVHSGAKGGTITGARENLKQGWVSLWVKPTNDKFAANELLVKNGGKWCVEKIELLDPISLVTNIEDKNSQSAYVQTSLFSYNNDQPDLFSMPLNETHSLPNISNLNELCEEKVDDTSLLEKEVDFYQLFIYELKRVAIQPKNIDELIEMTGLHKTQVNFWVQKALDDGHLKKLTKPVRYQLLRQ